MNTNWRQTIPILLVSLIPQNCPRASDLDTGDVKIIRVLPRTESEITQAHERSRAEACEPVPPEMPLEINSYSPVLTERDSREFDRGRLLLPSSRRHMFTVGLDMQRDDKARLPTVS